MKQYTKKEKLKRDFYNFKVKSNNLYKMPKTGLEIIKINENAPTGLKNQQNYAQNCPNGT